MKKKIARVSVATRVKLESLHRDQNTVDLTGDYATDGANIAGMITAGMEAMDKLVDLHTIGFVILFEDVDIN